MKIVAERKERAKFWAVGGLGEEGLSRRQTWAEHDVCCQASLFWRMSNPRGVSSCIVLGVRATHRSASCPSEAEPSPWTTAVTLPAGFVRYCAPWWLPFEHIFVPSLPVAGSDTSRSHCFSQHLDVTESGEPQAVKGCRHCFFHALHVLGMPCDRPCDASQHV